MARALALIHLSPGAGRKAPFLAMGVVFGEESGVWGVGWVLSHMEVIHKMGSLQGSVLFLNVRIVKLNTVACRDDGNNL